MSKSQAFEPNVISSLGDISAMHKLLYVTLWSRADPVGVVQINLPEISAVAGCTYRMDDLTHFGDRLIELNPSEYLLSLYLKITVGTLSAKSKGQSKVWECLEARWKATKQNPQPFFEAWKNLKIGIYAPEMPDEYTGEENLCQRVKEFREDLQECLKVDTPHTWPDEVAKQFKAFIATRVAIALKKTSKSDTDKYQMLPSMVMSMQETVQEMLNDGHSPKKIAQKIRDNNSSNSKIIYSIDDK